MGPLFLNREDDRPYEWGGSRAKDGSLANNPLRGGYVSHTARLKRQVVRVKVVALLVGCF